MHSSFFDKKSEYVSLLAQEDVDSKAQFKNTQEKITTIQKQLDVINANKNRWMSLSKIVDSLIELKDADCKSVTEDHANKFLKKLEESKLVHSQTISILYQHKRRVYNNRGTKTILMTQKGEQFIYQDRNELFLKQYKNALKALKAEIVTKIQSGLNTSSQLREEVMKCQEEVESQMGLRA